MKKFRKIMAILVAALMIAATMVPAWAAVPTTANVSVTITYNKGNGTGSATATATVSAGDDYAWFELPTTAPAGLVNPNGKTQFIGWSLEDTSALAEGTSPTLVKRLLVSAEDTAKTVYAYWAANDAASRTNYSFTDTGSITVNNAVNGETYKAYQLFQLFSYDDLHTLPDQHTADEEAYAYYIVSAPENKKSPLYDFLKSYNINDVSGHPAFEFFDSEHADGDKSITISGSTYTPVRATSEFMSAASGGDENTVTEYQGTTAKIQQFAIAAMKYIVDENLTADAKILKDTEVAADGKASLDSLPLGYYLVDSSLGSLCSLDTTNKDISTVEKNEFTSSEKKVGEVWAEASTTTFGDKNDANFGDTINFKSTVNVPLRASGVIYHDVMNDNAFELTGITIKVGDTTFPAANYKVYADVNAANTTVGDVKADPFPTHTEGGNAVIDTEYTGDTFAIKFLDTWSEIQTADTEVTITYTATLLKTAEVGNQYQTGTTTPKAMGEGNDNQSWVTYGKKQQKSSVDWTRTYTWGFNVFKYAKYDAISTVASGDQYKTKDAYDVDGKAAHEDGYIYNESYEDTTVTADYHVDAHYWIKAKPLSGAKFTLKKAAIVYDTVAGTVTSTTPGSAIRFIEINPATMEPINQTEADANGTHTGVYRLELTGETTGSTYLTTYPETNGLIQIVGLDSNDEEGTARNSYILEEDTAPVGYFKLKDSITVTLDKTAVEQGDDNTKQNTGNAVLKRGGTATGDIAVINETGNELPSTGGMGTTVLYIVGGMLVILAGAYLFFSRKRTA